MPSTYEITHFCMVRSQQVPCMPLLKHVVLNLWLMQGVGESTDIDTIIFYACSDRFPERWCGRFWWSFFLSISASISLFLSCFLQARFFSPWLFICITFRLWQWFIRLLYALCFRCLCLLCGSIRKKSDTSIYRIWKIAFPSCHRTFLRRRYAKMILRNCCVFFAQILRNLIRRKTRSTPTCRITTVCGCIRWKRR